MPNRGRHKKKSKLHLIVQILGIKIANRLMECQIEQKNPPNLDIFLNTPYAGRHAGGFNWANAKEGHGFWDTMLAYELQNDPLYKKWKNERRQRLH